MTHHDPAKFLAAMSRLAAVAPTLNPDDITRTISRERLAHFSKNLGLTISDRMTPKEIWGRIVAVISNKNEIGITRINSDSGSNKRRGRVAETIEMDEELIRQRANFERMVREDEEKIREAKTPQSLSPNTLPTVLHAFDQSHMTPTASAEEMKTSTLLSSSSRMPPPPQPQQPAPAPFDAEMSRGKRGRDEVLAPPPPAPLPIPFMPGDMSFAMGVKSTHRPSRMPMMNLKKPSAPVFILTPWMASHGGILDQLDYATVKAVLGVNRDDYQTYLPAQFLQVEQEWKEWLPKLSAMEQSLAESKEVTPDIQSLFMYLNRLQAQRGKYMSLLRQLEADPAMLERLQRFHGTDAHRCMLEMMAVYELSMQKAYLFYDLITGVYPAEVEDDIREQIVALDREGRDKSAAFIARGCWSSLPE